MANHQQLGSKEGRRSGGGWRAAVIEMACSRIRRRKKKTIKKKKLKLPCRIKITSAKFSNNNVSNLEMNSREMKKGPANIFFLSPTESPPHPS